MNKILAFILAFASVVCICTAAISVNADTAPVLTISDTSLIMGVGETYKLTCTVSGNAGSPALSYATNNKNIVDVKNGLLKAKGTGGATIRVSLKGAKSVFCKIIVRNAPKSLTMPLNAIALEYGKTAVLNVSMNKGSASCKGLWYTSSDKSIVLVNRDGLIRAQNKTGSAFITVKTYNGIKIRCVVRTVAPAKQESPEYTLINPKQGVWYLLVVDRYRRISQNYTPQLSPLLQSEGYDVSLDSRVVPYYEKMYYAAKADGIILKPYSAYRRYSTQKKNFENRIALWRSRGYGPITSVNKTARVILPPGGSEHNLGLAVDINGTNYDFNKTKAYSWLSKNAHKYGFIQRYSDDMENITGVIGEPWHWRFVGVDDATAMRRSGVCLEQYLKSKFISY